jgi:hypothetical protein
MEYLRRHLGRSGLTRVEKMVRIWLGDDQPEYPNRFQQPFRLFMPGLVSKPWYNPNQFKWTQELEDSVDLVKQELNSVLCEGVFQPYLSPFDELLHAANSATAQHQPELSDIRVGIKRSVRTEWSAYFLFRDGEWISVNSSLCCNTKRLLSLTNMGLGEALFSCLPPKTNIRLHSGGCNVVLTCHLGLIVPESCAIRVGTETRNWEAGKVMIFDDSYLHMAWNHGDRERIILLWDIWHPDLTELEIAAMLYLFPLIMKDYP